MSGIMNDIDPDVIAVVPIVASARRGKKSSSSSNSNIGLRYSRVLLCIIFPTVIRFYCVVHRSFAKMLTGDFKSMERPKNLQTERKSRDCIHFEKH